MLRLVKSITGRRSVRDLGYVMEKEWRKSWRKPSRREMTYTVAIEGNIGSGKSTLLQYFSKFENTMIMQEPVEKWRNMKGFNLLDLMYSDPKRWSLTFQTYVQLTMLHNHQALHTAEVKLMERSIYSARHCFVENMFRSQLMPKVEYLVLCEWYNWLVSKEKPSLDLIVYLRTRPETVYNRIQQRCRKEEKSIPLEYLKNLHDLHEEWLMSKDFPFPVLVLEADCGLDDMEKVFEKHACDILFRDQMPPRTGKAMLDYILQQNIPEMTSLVGFATGCFSAYLLSVHEDVQSMNQRWKKALLRIDINSSKCPEDLLLYPSCQLYLMENGSKHQGLNILNAGPSIL